MELLEKETVSLYLRHDWTPFHYVFLKEEKYSGINSHQEAVLEFLNCSNRFRECLRLMWSDRNPMKIDHEAYARKFHELNEEKINYTDIRFFDKMKEYPIYVNKEMMRA
ncbi:hypothetical protein E5K30_001991, partial [Enterococcus faecium]|nr:hypothetical protein [Enterococcus faecium]